MMLNIFAYIFSFSIDVMIIHYVLKCSFCVAMLHGRLELFLFWKNYKSVPKLQHSFL
jgi:hypothetical protein